MEQGHGLGAATDGKCVQLSVVAVIVVLLCSQLTAKVAKTGANAELLMTVTPRTDISVLHT